MTADLLQTPAAVAQMAQMLADQERFHATRPPCPSTWCDGGCEAEGHFGDAMLHSSPEVTIPATPDRVGVEGASVWVRAWRHDGLDEPSESGVEVDVSEAMSILPERANFSAEQARQLAAALTAAADMIDPVGGSR